MSSDSTSLVIILVCLVLSAYFSATETAFSTMSHARMKTMADKGDKSAALALQLADNYDTLLSAILIGNNLVNILLSSVATLLFVKFLGEQTGASVATASVTVVVLIFGEISPKSIAKESPEKFAMFSAPFIRALMVLLKPFIWMFAQWKKLLVKLFNKPSDDRGITDEELMTIVEEAEQEGGIDADESTLIRSAIGFMDLETSDIYTPRVDIESIPLDATKEEIAKRFLLAVLFLHGSNQPHDKGRAGDRGIEVRHTSYQCFFFAFFIIFVEFIDKRHQCVTEAGRTLFCRAYGCI